MKDNMVFNTIYSFRLTYLYETIYIFILYYRLLILKLQIRGLSFFLQSALFCPIGSFLLYNQLMLGYWLQITIVFLLL